MKALNSSLLIVFFVLTSSFHWVFAQSNPPDPRLDPNRPTGLAKIKQEQNAQENLTQYINADKSKIATFKRVGMLHATETAGLAKTPDNVKLIRVLLGKNISEDEEKIGLIRLLASQHTYNDVTGMNNAIRNDIRNFTNASQNMIAAESAITYSRLGYFSDTEAILTNAKNRGVLDDDSYFGELTRLLGSAPASNQITMLNKIRSSKNAFALGLLAGTVSFHEHLYQINPEARKIALSMFNESEPKYVLSIGEFVTNGISYANWLNSLALLEQNVNGQTYKDVVYSRLSAPSIDPRKIMEYLSSPEGERFITSMGEKRYFSELKASIELYSKQLPQNATMREMVEDIGKKINTLPK